MPILDALHDRGHPVEEDPHWSESYYFNAYAPESQVGFFSRIAIRPNEPHIDGFVTLWLPPTGTARLAESRDCDVPAPGEPALDALRFVCVTPMKQWRVVAEGESDEGRQLAIDATFCALSPAIGVDATGRRASHASGTSVAKSLASGHFEQAGTWQGTVRIDGVAHALVGRGNRDKSWGPRRTDGGRGMQYWRWFSMNFGTGTHLGGIRVGTEGGDLQRGWLFRDGRFTTIRSWDLRTEVDDVWRQRRVSIVARDKRGDAHSIEGQVLRVARIHARGHEHMTIWEGLTRWSYAGQTGYGICEYAHQLDPTGKPVVPIE